MNPRNLIFIVLAVAGAALVVLLTRSFLSSAQQEALTAQSQTPRTHAIKILVAKRDLSAGTIVTQEDFIWQPWPENGLSDAYYRAGTDKQEILTNKVVRTPLTKGQPFTRSSVVAQGERGFLAAILTEGMRAVTVKLSPTSGIGGFIFPGDRVDVILTHEMDISRTEKYQIAETVFQNVRVLAVDQKSTSDDQAKIAKTATLEVTPKMAEKMAMMDKIGELSLSLRSLANSGDGLTSDPLSPPVSVTTTHTMGSDISRFVPSMDMDTSKTSIRVARGSEASIVDIGGNKISANAYVQQGDNP
ncbi:Flp pilus assembly protein CpaB [Kordiimonas pumila]|uniref:Flp pilus assembly protein CpaB n=1 Tax=Kordiimonas pumila TaxID=2161677 RepID=A0ABV7D5Q1_9PROT|nr:Flp pilus assembly protein CpaB [Kordiimonas pumila]